MIGGQGVLWLIIADFSEKKVRGQFCHDAESSFTALSNLQNFSMSYFVWLHLVMSDCEIKILTLRNIGQEKKNETIFISELGMYFCSFVFGSQKWVHTYIFHRRNFNQKISIGNFSFAQEIFKEYSR